jgi:glutaredoxin
MNQNLDKYITHIQGEYKGEIILFSLSNCARCNKVKKALNEMGVEYYYIDIDHADQKDRPRLMETVEKWNPACIFPTVVINKTTCITGDPSRITESLEEYCLPVVRTKN